MSVDKGGRLFNLEISATELVLDINTISIRLELYQVLGETGYKRITNPNFSASSSIEEEKHHHVLVALCVVFGLGR